MLACIVITFSRKMALDMPIRTAIFRMPTLPQWVIFTYQVFGLPFTMTRFIAKCMFIAIGLPRLAFQCFSTIRTRLFDSAVLRVFTTTPCIQSKPIVVTFFIAELVVAIFNFPRRSM
jgi:hypothetical protein